MFGFIEATLVFGLVVGWGGRELWLLRRDREQQQRESTARGESEGPSKSD
jgi:hypothetical protein